MILIAVVFWDALNTAVVLVLLCNGQDPTVYDWFVMVMKKYAACDFSREE